MNPIEKRHSDLSEYPISGSRVRDRQYIDEKSLQKTPFFRCYPLFCLPSSMQMDSFKPQKAKTRKTKVMTARKSTVQILSNLFFRAIETAVVVITVTKLFSQFVITFENSSERFKGLASILANRHFVFFFGNVVVIITFLTKYGQLPNQESDAQSTSTSNTFYDEFVRESSRREERNSWAEARNIDKHGIIQDEGTKEVVVKQSNRQRQYKSESEGVTEKKRKQITTEHEQKGRVVEMESITHIQRQDTGEVRAKEKKNCMRSRSENMRVSCGRMTRSETERCLLDTRGRDPNEGMSNDELRYKIESFIARQRKIQKGE